MIERTYLTTTFQEKDRVKSLGARWDPTASRWYVPEGLDLAAFAAWLPAGFPEPPLSREVDTLVKGVPLSSLLSGVAAAIARAFTEGVWTTAEVVRASTSKGHYYLELSEHNEVGEVLAQARAVIWARHAQALLAEFRRATGAELDAGIKVLLRAKPVFKAQFGLSLEVDGIDPSYTLGDLEARKREIRERLKREGLYNRNRALPAPWDYTAVLVIAPERAAGLGDFAKEAQRLENHGACQFNYAYSRFQGEGAAADIVRAIDTGLRTWSGSSLPDAVVILRGGGSVNDLAWLNDYALARCVCECPVPVLTGIGHERDETSVDEVAHRKYDTPSKVIAGIEDVMRTRIREARALHDFILNRARADLITATASSRQAHQNVESGARSALVRTRSDTEALLHEVRLRAVSAVHEARTRSRDTFDGLRGDARAHVAKARQLAPTALSRVTMGAITSVHRARHQMELQLPFVLERAVGMTKISKQGLESVMLETFDRASRSIALASDRSQALFREIAGQGPQKTLRRGFAVVRTQTGKTVTTVDDVHGGADIQVRLRDGTVGAVVQTMTRAQDESD